MVVEPPNLDKRMFMFLKHSYYPKVEDKSLRRHLEKAMEHLQRHVDQETAGWTWMWPRVLALLGENRQTVEEAFYQKGRADKGLARNKEKYHIRLGEYLEHIGDNKQAIENFSLAVNCSTDTDNKVAVYTKYARNRLEKLQQK